MGWGDFGGCGFEGGDGVREVDGERGWGGMGRDGEGVKSGELKGDRGDGA